VTVGCGANLHNDVVLLSPGSYSSEICRTERLRALNRGNVSFRYLAVKGSDRPIYLWQVSPGLAGDMLSLWTTTARSSMTFGLGLVEAQTTDRFSQVLVKGGRIAL
jgi:hypothetical protein